MIKKYTLQNLDCANCAQKIEDKLQNTPGVKFAAVSFATGTLAVDTDNLSLVEQTVRQIEPEISLIAHGHETRPAGMSQADRLNLIRIGLALILFLIGLIFYAPLHATPFHLAEYAVMVPAYLLSGYPVLRGALRNIRQRKVFDEYFLMTIATLGAWLIHAVPEAVGVMIFYMFGEFLQDLAVNRSRRSIKSLLAIKPETASLIVDGQTQEVPVEQVAVSERVVVRPGERVPLDGIVQQGSSQVDTSALTGEHVPRKFKPGDEILAGMINQSDMLEIEVIRPAAESAVARILDLVENASSRKAPTERFMSRFARYYTPVVVLLAAGIAIVPPLVVPGAQFADWLYRALVVLVISCPCALVVSIPLGYFGGIGAASRRGILVKGSNYLDVLAAVKTVVFDKTGTLTRGVFQLVEVHPVEGLPAEALLRTAALAEKQSNHPIARSVLRAAEASLPALPTGQPDGFQEISGQGVRTRIHDDVLLAGNDRFMHTAAIAHPTCDVPGTVVHVAKNDRYLGYLRIDDVLKADARQAIAALRSAGIQHIAMLTGDQAENAALMARELGLDAYRAGLLPGEKVQALEAIMQQQSESQARVAYVGDGINDAPVIARADVGIAMGALGSEAAIESADVVIMSDAPARVADAIRIGRQTRRIVWQNIVLALGIKAIFIALGITGEANMWVAVFADMGVALLAILNSARIIR
jgi:Cd2+/Zn2+-exporting ATPase